MISYGYGVLLAPIDSHQIETLREWRNNDVIRKFCRQNGLISDLDQKKWFEWQNNQPDIRMFCVMDTEKKVCGVVGLTSIDLINSRAEFSLYIAPDRSNEGLGKGALKSICKYGFDELGLNSIWCESFDFNPAIEVFKAVGFKLDGIRRAFYFKGGHFVNAVLMSLMRSEVTF